MILFYITFYTTILIGLICIIEILYTAFQDQKRFNNDIIVKLDNIMRDMKYFHQQEVDREEKYNFLKIKDLKRKEW